MAGQGSRFSCSLPKPMILVDDLPMFAKVYKNLGIQFDKTIFLVQQSHIDEYQIDEMIKMYIHPTAIVIGVNGLTDGTACTVKLAEPYLNPNDTVIVSNCDQIVEYDKDELCQQIMTSDAGMTLFHCPDKSTKWSYAEYDTNTKDIAKVEEKQPISEWATVGHYYWKRASDMFRSIDTMIDANDRYNNEFYLAPSFNYTIAAGLTVKGFVVGAMYGIGTPEDLSNYSREAN